MSEQRLTVFVGGGLRATPHQLGMSYGEAGEPNELTEDQPEQIRPAAPGADVRYFASRARARGADRGGRGRRGAALGRRARPRRRLKWVQSWAAGPDALMYPGDGRQPGRLHDCKGNGAIPLAEHAMMLMLMLNRDAPRWLRAQARASLGPLATTAS